MVGTQLMSDVRAYLNKLKAHQTKIYGIMAHGLVPEELIYAAGGFPLRLSIAGDKNATTAGIEYLTSATCSFAQGTIGQFEKDGLYSELDAIIGANYCNGELCATELISKYFKIPKLNIVFPSTKNKFALKFMIAELRHFQEDLEQMAGTQCTEELISQAIQLYNTERKLIQEIVALQAEKDYVLTGVECLDLLYNHFLFGINGAIENFQKVLAALKERSSVKKGKRLLFVGNGVPIGDNIIQLIENQGFLVSKNLTWTGLDYITSFVEENIDPLIALATYYLNAENSGRMILSDNYVTNLAKIYENTQVDGIILYKVKHCSIVPAVISAKLKELLADKKIPYLELERDYGTTQDTRLQTQIQAFKEVIG
jgi:benzoyl-CoA reductase/2-hydroxyglutaryl-CoA dehydratase subunit BcrC/BadD/HgdB